MSALRVADAIFNGQPLKNDEKIRPCELNRACVNPEHTRVPVGEDTMRYRKRRDVHTHCRNGHPYTKKNTKKGTDGRRWCLICEKENMRAKAVALMKEIGWS